MTTILKKLESLGEKTLINSKIEIIIPLYNCALFIKKCVNSVSNQNSLLAKIIIVDDASIDDSFNIALNLNNLQLYRNNKNLGNLKTINKLFNYTTAPYIAFQDADDWSAPDRLSKQLDFLNKKKLDFCFTNYIKVDSDAKNELYCGNINSNIIITKENAVEVEALVCFASILMKREVYDKIGGFNSYFNRIGGADIDWYYRAISAGFKGGILKQPLYYYRNNEESYTSTVSLDPRKQISLEIARYFYQNNYRTDKLELQKFISTTLVKKDFNKKENLKQFIVQQLKHKKHFDVFTKTISYLLTKPHKVEDIKLLKYIAYKITNG